MLDTRLRLRRNRSLWSRIHTRLHLGEAAPDDTAEYVELRLHRAGRTTDNPFDSDALALLHEAADGRLRDIDRIRGIGLRARQHLRPVLLSF